MKDMKRCIKTGKEPVLATYQNSKTGKCLYAFYSPEERAPRPDEYRSLKESPFFESIGESVVYWNNSQLEELPEEIKNHVLAKEATREYNDLVGVRNRLYDKYIDIKKNNIDDKLFMETIELCIPYLYEDIRRFKMFVGDDIPDDKYKVIKDYINKYPYISNKYYKLERKDEL